jgi:hypothetical protein
MWKGIKFPQIGTFLLDGAAPESNRPSRGLHDRTGFEDQLGHRAHAAPVFRLDHVRPAVRSDGEDRRYGADLRAGARARLLDFSRLEARAGIGGRRVQRKRHPNRGSCLRRTLDRVSAGDLVDDLQSETSRLPPSARSCHAHSFVTHHHGDLVSVLLDDDIEGASLRSVGVAHDVGYSLADAQPDVVDETVVRHEVGDDFADGFARFSYARRRCAQRELEAGCDGGHVPWIPAAQSPKRHGVRPTRARSASKRDDSTRVESQRRQLVRSKRWLRRRSTCRAMRSPAARSKCTPSSARIFTSRPESFSTNGA